MGKVFVIAGPAGVGKNELIKRVGVDDLGLVYIPSYTTRKPRAYESQGNPYYFLTLSEFMNKQNNNEFIEAEEVHGNWYGTDKAKYQSVLFSGASVIKDIDVKGALKFKETFGTHAVLIYIEPPSMAELERRLVGRGSGDSEETKLRLSRARMENDLAKHFDHRIVNDNIDTAVTTLKNIIQDDGVAYVDPMTLRYSQHIRNMDSEKLERLIESMKVQGYDGRKPITVVKSIDGLLYVSDGHHRALAAIANRIDRVPILTASVKWIPFSGIDQLQYDYEDIIANLLRR